MTRAIFLILGFLAITGCTRIDTNFGMASTPLETSRAAVAASPYNVRKINVDVPRSLSVSEANAYFPRADIVWRGDPFGDRHAQVARIMQSGLEKGTGALRGRTPVVLDIRLQRFHALSDKARYSFGGVHNIVFAMQIRSAATGQVVQPWRLINAEFPAAGGTAAIEEERRGLTQKVLIERRLAQVIQYELSATPAN